MPVPATRELSPAEVEASVAKMQAEAEKAKAEAKAAQAEVRKSHRKDWWLSSDEALKLGLIDSIR